MNCPRACSDVEANAARGLAHSSGPKPQVNRAVADGFEKNNEFSPFAQACGVLGIFPPRMPLHDGELSLRAYTTSGVLKSPRTPDIVSSHQPVRWTVREFHTQKYPNETFKGPRIHANERRHRYPLDIVPTSRARTL
jgi:hypothetical protein